MPQPFRSFVLTPKPGRGVVTSRSPQSLGEYTDSLAFAQNILFKDGAWIARGDDLTTDIVSGATGPCYGIHYYNSIDPATPNATPTTVYLMHTGQNTDETGTSTLRRSDTGVVSVNSVNFTTTTPSDIFFLNIKNRCFVAGTKMGTGVYPSILAKYPSAANYRWGIDTPTSDLSYDAYTKATNTTTKVYFTASGATVSNGSNSVAKNGGANWDSGTAWVGKTVQLNAVDYTIVSYTPTTGPMIIDPAWVDDGSGPNTHIRVQYGEIGWPDTGPSYAYVYYNPTTGHMSNASPTLTISEPSISNVRVKISGIPLTNDSNYTRVVLFRTAFEQGGNLLPLKLSTSHGGTATVNASDFMIENTSSGTVTYVDFQADSNLGKILGPLPAPIINDPPPTDIRYMAYWDQRVWVVSAATRYRLQFSGNATQIELGVPEECFPDNNFRDISADDGFITGLKVVGTSLLVCTERYLYFVDGTNEGTYRLQRISSRGSGVDQYAIDEHPGDSSEQSASAIYVSREKRLWRQYPGGRIEDIGWQIQDKLDLINFNLRRPVTVKVVQVGKSWFLMLGIRFASPIQYCYLFYDFDEQSWGDMNMGNSALWGSGYSGYVIGFWSGNAAGIDYSSNSAGVPAMDVGTDGAAGFQRARLSGLNNNPTSGRLTTQDLDFGDKQIKKSFHELVIHTDETSDARWTVVVEFDRDPAKIYTLKLNPVTGTPRYMGTNVLRYTLDTETANVNQFHTMTIGMEWNGSTVGKKVFKLVVNYTVEATGIAGSEST